MRNESWEFIKFAIKLNLRYHPRLWVAPLVGAVRNTRQVIGRMSAETDEFIAQQRRRSAEAATTQSPTNGARPATSEQSH
jgi:hypothetical protein